MKPIILTLCEEKLFVLYNKSKLQLSVDKKKISVGWWKRKLKRALPDH
jgi:hypothetical protein